MDEEVDDMAGLHNSSPFAVILTSEQASYDELKVVLSRRGFFVSVCHNLKEAIVKILTMHPSVLLLDVDYPSQKISVIAKVAKKYHSKISVVAYSRSEESLNGWSEEKNIDVAFKVPLSKQGAVEFDRIVVEQDNNWIRNGEAKSSPVMSESTFKHVLSRLDSLDKDDTHVGNLDFVKEKAAGILSASKTSIEAVLPPDRSQLVKPLSLTTQISCFYVKSKTLEGYLFFAKGGDDFLADYSNEFMQLKWVDQFKKMGYEIEATDTLSVHLAPMPFKEWAVQGAEFLSSLVHAGEEIAFAFFEIPDVLGEVVHMSAQFPEHNEIDIAWIPADKVLNFDLYIHLKLNNRIHMYVAKGGVLRRDQKTRLKEDGHSKVLLHNSQLKDFRSQILAEYLWQVQ
jgi:hypothetical protein